MTDETILYQPDPDEAFVTITLHRPDKLNAIDRTLAAALDDAIARACADPAIGAILLTGGGRAFSVGYDLVSEDYANDAEWWRDNIDECCRHLFAIWNAPLPIVAAVNGFALAGGLELMLCCDLAIAAEDAGAPSACWSSPGPTSRHAPAWPKGSRRGTKRIPQRASASPGRS
jgi:enoyl-CoA hydratase